jgi:hypothetical protein
MVRIPDEYKIGYRSLQISEDSDPNLIMDNELTHACSYKMSCLYVIIMSIILIIVLVDIIIILIVDIDIIILILIDIILTLGLIILILTGVIDTEWSLV